MSSRRAFLSWAGVVGAGVVALLTAKPTPPRGDVYLDVYPRRGA